MYGLTATLLVMFSTAGLLFAGCGIVKTEKIERGFDIHDGDVQNIVKGKTTERDFVKTFGPPTKVKNTHEGKEYLYEYSSPYTFFLLNSDMELYRNSHLFV